MFFASQLRWNLKRALTVALSAMLFAGNAGFAQQMPSGQGAAFKLDYLKLAREVSPRDAYGRALYDYLRANPAQWDNPTFYVNFLIYLMSKHPGFDCSVAFANEFERRDFFTTAPAMKESLRQIVNTTRLPNRFDVGYVIETGEYDFQSARLPFSHIASVGMDDEFSGNTLSRNDARACANTVLRGTDVSIESFPWRFTIVDERQQRSQPQFPFGNELQLAPNDARTLFERFGRELFAIVSFRFQAATNGQRMIMVIPTDGQLFGLGRDAVVRVETHRHATMSQPDLLDFSNPLDLSLRELGTTMELAFQQDGFRAVGTGTRQEEGTSLTAGRSFDVAGSAAVGQSAFIMRIETAGLQMPRQYRHMNTEGGGPRQITLFGNVDFSKITASAAPVVGTVFIEIPGRQSGRFTQYHRMRFNGAFRPPEAVEVGTATADE